MRQAAFVPTSLSIDPAAKRAVEVELLQILYGRTVTLTIAGLPTAFIVAFVFSLQLTNDTALWIWLSLRIVLTAIRLQLVLTFHRTFNAITSDIQQWRKIYIAVMLVDGAVWGAFGFLMPDSRPDLHGYAMACLLVFSASAWMLQSVDLQVGAAYSVPLIVPSALFDSFSQPSYHGMRPAGAFMMFCLLGMMLLVTRKSAVALKSHLFLKFHAARLSGERAEALAMAQREAQGSKLFFASISHEMRTPLHGILGTVRLLQTQSDGIKDSQKLQMLSASAELLLELINDVLDFSTLSAGKMKFALQDVELPALLQEVHSLLEPLALQKHLAWHLSIDPSVPTWIQSDPNRLKQIILNLGGNAIKFTREGSVSVSAAWRRGELRIDVVDTGPGIPEQHLQRIFKPYERVDTVDAQSTTGNGLGLSLAYELTSALGGELQCHSVMGQGSTFILTLPVQPMQLPEPVPSATPCTIPRRDDNVGIGVDVMIVEDNPVNVLIAEAALSGQGWSVIQASTGEEAIELARQHRPRVILMDINLPGMNGLDTIHAIQQMAIDNEWPLFKVLVLSASREDEEPSHQKWISGSLTKPFEPQQLKIRVQALLATAPMDGDAHSIPVVAS